MYKISVIIPVYNVENTISKAFDSIYNQSIDFQDIEVIFVDDCSTDNSLNIIQDYASKYDNVRALSLEENSGYAGKPRNIGIKNASSDYVMFLDPDDQFLSNACEILYNAIKNYNADLVSGNYVKYENNEYSSMNWDYLNLENSIIQVKTIDEEVDLLKVNPSVWAKIIRKDFITENNIIFPEFLPAQDMVFVGECLLKSKNTVFINKPVVKYITSDNIDSGNKHVSVTSRKSFNTLSGFIKSYKLLYNLLEEYNPSYTWIAVRHLYFWTTQFCTCQLGFEDKLSLLTDAGDLYEKFQKSDNLKPQKEFELFFELVYQKDYYHAIKLSDLLSLYLNDSNITGITKNKDVLILFYGFDMNIGGLAKAVFNRANMLDENGYRVTLLNIDPNIIDKSLSETYKNVNLIENHFRDLGYINDNVKFVNMFEYLSKKNTVDYTEFNRSLDYIDFENNIYVDDRYIIEKINHMDDSQLYNYYNRNNFSTEEITLLQENVKNEEFIIRDNINVEDKLFKSELYINNSLITETIYSNGLLKENNIYTCDGFKFVSVEYDINKNLKINLFDRTLDSKTTYTSFKDFVNNFLYDYIKQVDTKPFLINDGSGSVPSIETISPQLVYKIGNIHSNPYKKPYRYGGQMRNVAVLDNIEDLDALVTLTNREREDFNKEFDYEKIYTIPNFINIEDYPNQRDFNKVDKNKISLFAKVSVEKNLEDAIEAMKIVHETNPDVRLEIFGKALKQKELEEQDKLQTLIKEYGLEDTVIFRGHVDDVNKQMQTSLVTILVSHFEGLPMVILESMANGVPVISYDINYGPSDVIINNVNGLLVEQYNVEQLAESIVFFINNPDKSKEYGDNARESVIENFSSDVVASKWEQVFEDAFLSNKIRLFNLTREYERGKIFNLTSSLADNQANNQKQQLNDMKTTLEYYKYKGLTRKKLFSWLPYIYILFNSRKSSEIILNIRLYRALQNNTWFDVGYYLNKNNDLSKRKWCEILTPETHYICNGYYENRKPNSKYFKKMSKKDILAKLQ